MHKMKWFRVKGGRSIIFLFLCLIMCIFVLHTLFSVKNNRLNILFITLDALRADHLGCYGYKRNTSPYIDSLASRGVLFTQAISQAPWTSASVSSLLTSRYPNHALVEVGYLLSAQEENLIGILKKKGYTTALFSNAYPTLSITFHDIRRQFSSFKVQDCTSEKVFDEISAWLKSKQRKPFFLWAYFYKPHCPYTCPDRYYNQYLKDGFYPSQKVPIAEDDGLKNEWYSFGVIPRCVAQKGITDTSYYIARYDGEINYVDEQIEKLMNSLKQSGLIKNTLIVVFSDHGESMTEHDFYFNHSHFLYEGLIRVPLIVVLPERLQKAKVVKEQVALMDIMPTVLDLLGMRSKTKIEGKSLLPLLWDRYLNVARDSFSESPYYPSPRCIRTGKWQLIYNRRWNNYELYNLKEDPWETHNLFYKRTDIAADLEQRLERWGRTARTHTLGSPKSPSNIEKERLKSLGYIQ